MVSLSPSSMTYGMKIALNTFADLDFLHSQLNKNNIVKDMWNPITLD